MVRPVMKALWQDANDVTSYELCLTLESFIQVIFNENVYQEFKKFSVTGKIDDNVAFLEEYFVLQLDLVNFLSEKKLIQLENPPEEIANQIKKHIIFQAIGHIEGTEGAKTVKLEPSPTGKTMDLHQSLKNELKVSGLASVIDGIYSRMTVPQVLVNRYLNFFNVFLDAKAPLEVNVPNPIQKSIAARVRSAQKVYENHAKIGMIQRRQSIDASRPHMQRRMSRGAVGLTDFSPSARALKLNPIIAEVEASSESESHFVKRPELGDSTDASYARRKSVSAHGNLELDNANELHVDVYVDAKNDVVRSLFLNTFPRFVQSRKKTVKST